jgi:hypothetical protein
MSAFNEIGRAEVMMAAVRDYAKVRAAARAAPPLLLRHWTRSNWQASPVGLRLFVMFRHQKQ